VSDKRIDFTVLGRKVGRATGWDQADTFAMQLYNFEPAVGVNLPKAEFMNFNFETGTAETFDEEGVVTFTADLVTVLAGVKAPMVTP
jgi:hypothetical protein